MPIIAQPLAASEVGAADRIFRLAFGTFLGLPDPLTFGGSAAIVPSRWRADPGGMVGAYENGVLVGVSAVTVWGRFGFLGPVSVRPDRWDQHIGRQLIAGAMAIMDQRGVRLAGLFTFPQSPKHLAFYQAFGFWPQYLTALMTKPAQSPPVSVAWTGYSVEPESAQPRCLAACAALTDAIFPGLDLAAEIRAIAAAGSGETVLVREGERVTGFAVCHLGEGSEAEAGTVYVKFAAVRPGAGAPERFARVLSACEYLARERGCQNIVAGVNTARHDAYRQMAHSGFRTAFIGVAMQRPNQPGFNRPDCFVLDDWR